MCTLFIDIASSKRMIACTEGTSLLASTTLPTSPNEILLEKLADLLRNKNISLESIRRIAAVRGPGGFMSLREGMAIANTLAQSLGVPVAGIHGSVLVQRRLETLIRGCLWVHSTRKESLFVRSLDETYPAWKEPTLVPLTTLMSMKDVPYIGELIPVHKEALSSWQECPLLPIESVLPIFVTTLEYSTTSLTPWYGREA